mmetsp:Transcript_29323/g.63012  ORF Transcript_29323/g.63012 Transcript_29323/m.63012 type:complete len:108 (+) Transcript_29323:210-533(+)
MLIVFECAHLLQAETALLRWHPTQNGTDEQCWHSSPAAAFSFRTKFKRALKAKCTFLHFGFGHLPDDCPLNLEAQIWADRQQEALLACFLAQSTLSRNPRVFWQPAP